MGIAEVVWDTAFDEQLREVEGLVRLPWVGLNFKSQACKTLVLGESVYDWSPEKPGNLEKISEPGNLRRLHKSKALNFDNGAAFVRNIEKAIYSKEEPSNSEKAYLWDSVVYHNLVSRVLKSIDHRPTFNDYLAGWSVFDRVVSIFGVDQVLVYGLEQKKIKALTKYCNRSDNDLTIVERAKLPQRISRSHPRKIVLEKNGKQISMLFIRHPSAFFSWAKWAPVIRSSIVVPKGGAALLPADNEVV